MKKRCNKCQKEKPMELFYFNEARKQFAPTCKVCAREKQKKARENSKKKCSDVNSQECSCCKRTKSIDSFPVDESGSPRHRCTACEIPWSLESRTRSHRKTYKKTDVEFVLKSLHLNGGDY